MRGALGDLVTELEPSGSPVSDVPLDGLMGFSEVLGRFNR
jgi:hypothetical protein